MNFTIRDFAPIKEADIKLDGLTVIAGDNDTGKSTVGKALYSLVQGIRAERRSTAQESGEKHPSGLALKQKGNTVGFITYLTLEAVLGRKQIHGQIGFSDVVVLKYSGLSMEAPVFGNKDESFSNALLLETPLIWQLFDTFQGIAAEQIKADALKENFPIKYPRTYFDAYARLNGSVKSIGTFENIAINKISETISGRIDFENNTPVFRRGNETFPIQSVATGIQAFGFMQRILELGIAAPGQLLILDEPEVHLHPKWQLEYARLLVDMVDQLGLTILLTTHSAVFVEAIEMIGRNKLGDKCSIYLSERNESEEVVMKEVTDDLGPIYKSLAMPLARLSLFQEDA